MTGILKTPLWERHREAGARLVEFAGFDMPVLYTSIVAEHRAVRGAAGIFDVSHMGEIRLRGPGAFAVAQRLFTRDLGKLSEGRVLYGLLCRADGGIVDDVTLARTGPDDLLFCVNAANADSDLAWIRSVWNDHARPCELLDESAATALLAVQGPGARAIVDPLLADPGFAPRRWRCVQTQLEGVPVLLSRTGYTGEDGYEIYLSADHAVAAWDLLLASGGGGLTPAGLGARDTLRTEMAFPLYGHELSLAQNPIEAGLDRFVDFGAGFIGEEALCRVRDAGPAERLVGLAIESRQVARSGYAIESEETVGKVTSGTFGPSVQQSIAIGYVQDRFSEAGTRLAVRIREKSVGCTVVPTPFFDRSRRPAGIPTDTTNSRAP